MARRAPCSARAWRLAAVLALVCLTPQPVTVRGDDDLMAEVLAAAEAEAHDMADPALQDERTMRRTHYSRDHPLTDLPGALESVRTAFYFPGYAGGADGRYSFPIGETVRLLSHFSHSQTDVEALQVTGMIGSINSPFDFDYYIANFSKPLQASVPAEAEFTFDFELPIHASLDPIEYIVATTIFYNDGRHVFASTLFNATVSLHYPPRDPAAQLLTILGIVLPLALVALGVCYVRNTNLEQAREKQRAEAAAAAAAAADDDGADDDWTGVAAAAAGGGGGGDGGSVRKRKAGKKKKK